ncbi:hypothetical protein KCU65_g302, partial [Aureobasidium melanogenum]
MNLQAQQTRTVLMEQSMVESSRKLVQIDCRPSHFRSDLNDIPNGMILKYSLGMSPANVECIAFCIGGNVTLQDGLQKLKNACESAGGIIGAIDELRLVRNASPDDINQRLTTEVSAHSETSTTEEASQAIWMRGSDSLTVEGISLLRLSSLLVLGDWRIGRAVWMPTHNLHKKLLM